MICCLVLLLLFFPLWISGICVIAVYLFLLCVCACLSPCIYVFTRCPHHPASIHHHPSPSHPSRLHCTIRHPGLSHRYSTSLSISTPIKTFSLCPFSSRAALRSLSISLLLIGAYSCRRSVLRLSLFSLCVASKVL